LYSFYHNVAPPGLGWRRFVVSTIMSPLRGFMQGAEFQNRHSVALKLHSHSVKRDHKNRPRAGNESDASPVFRALSNYTLTLLSGTTRTDRERWTRAMQVPYFARSQTSLSVC